MLPLPLTAYPLINVLLNLIIYYIENPPVYFLYPTVHMNRTGIRSDVPLLIPRWGNPVEARTQTPVCGVISRVLYPLCHRVVKQQVLSVSLCNLCSATAAFMFI